MSPLDTLCRVGFQSGFSPFTLVKTGGDCFVESSTSRVLLLTRGGLSAALFALFKCSPRGWDSRSGHKNIAEHVKTVLEQANTLIILICIHVYIFVLKFLLFLSPPSLEYVYFPPLKYNPILVNSPPLPAWEPYLIFRIIMEAPIVK